MVEARTVSRPPLTRRSFTATSSLADSKVRDAATASRRKERRGMEHISKKNCSTFPSMALSPSYDYGEEAGRRGGGEGEGEGR